MCNKNRLQGGLALLLSMVSLMAVADGGISYDRNRVVYHEGSHSEAITARNGGSQLYLLQSGTVTSPGGNEEGPFWVTPPIVRLEGNSQNVLRVIGRADLLAALPRDRESVFYFFANAIPAQSGAVEGDNTAHLSIGIKTVLKLFWRPKGLTGNPDKVAESLKVSMQEGRVVFRNPTSYYASFAQLTLNGRPVDLNQQPSMIPPYGELAFAREGTGGQASWRLMTDYGGASVEQTAPLGVSVAK
ncbi:fimbrial biogenesis chaperone [Serratia proteamaculans]|uniref:fimbrial biogenesis chaperone n=1 Tax=Serratia proteamaculans TaxID=28151 RepID=UPI00217BBD20|nr:molecular chaperone [Serratia proteamaculans]CAI1209849.1 Chaperone protein fimC precursor [Serratia proteamaculans]